jgi:hypothetical protein
VGDYLPTFDLDLGMAVHPRAEISRAYRNMGSRLCRAFRHIFHTHCGTAPKSKKNMKKEGNCAQKAMIKGLKKKTGIQRDGLFVRENMVRTP